MKRREIKIREEREKKKIRGEERELNGRDSENGNKYLSIFLQSLSSSLSFSISQQITQLQIRLIRKISPPSDLSPTPSPSSLSFPPPPLLLSTYSQVST